MNARTNRLYSTIDIICTDAELDSMLCYLDSEMESLENNPSASDTLIELLDTIQRKTRSGKLFYGHFNLQFVIAFYLAHNVRWHVLNNPSAKVNDATALLDFCAIIDAVISETLGEAEYHRLTQGQFQETSSTYHEYLNHLYQCHSPRLNSADKKDLLAHLFDQLMKKDNHMQATAKYWSGCVTICPYDTFSRLCEIWMERNEEEDIFCDELLVDDDFISRGYTWRLFKQDNDTVLRCAQCVLGPQEQCIMHHPWHPVPRP